MTTSANPDQSPSPLLGEPSWFDSSPLPAAVHEAVHSLDVPDLVEHVLTQCSAAVFTQHTHDADFLGALRASVAQNAYGLRDVLTGETSLADVELDVVLHFATVQAQLHIPQKSMQRSYRVSFYTQWELWTRHVYRWLVDHEVEGIDTAETLTHLTRIILSYQDHVASLVAETYTRDHQALSRSRAHIRKNLVRDVLRGEADALSTSDQAILGYPLHGHHVAVLLPDMAEGAASQLADSLRSAGNSHDKLVYPLTLGSTVVWLCRLEPWRETGLAATADLLTRLGATASISNPAEGVAGLAASLQQAQEIERVRKGWGGHQAPTVMRYADAGLEILLTQNDDLARAFVSAELGPLAEPTNEAARLRETLEASFQCGSHVAAAQHLELHEHTVRNRLHKAEELLGRSLQERRTELRVAVRLMRLIDRATDDELGSGSA